VKLRDVVDLEIQLASDEGQPDDALRVRDRELYLAMSPAPTAPAALIRGWLDGLRARQPSLRIGARLEAAQRVLSYVLALSGLASGWGVAEVLLHFEQGGAPINVGHYLLVLVFGQLALLLLLGVSFTLRRWLAGLPVVGDVHRVLRFAGERLSRLWTDRPELREELEARQVLLQRVRTRFGLYSQLERFLLLSQSQLFGLAFNLGALASCLRLILLSDLAFAWSTSVAALDVEQVRRVCAVLAAPFGWLVPDAVPSEALIEHTQYYRLEGRFAGAPAGTRGDPQLAGEWWRFLVACTVAYGLLPRTATFALARSGLARAERAVPLDTPAVQRLLTRMTTPALSTRAQQLPAQGAEPARRVDAQPRDDGSAVRLILFRDIPTPASMLSAELTRQLGVQVASVHSAGGVDARIEARLLDTLGTENVCVVTEAWEAPDKSLRELLAALRRRLGPRRSVRVVLMGEADTHGWSEPAPDDVRLFRDRLTLLQDPYLSVEALTAARAGGEASA
jgi:hypothetical protein